MLVRIADPYSDLDNCESRKGDGGLLVTRRSLGGNGILNVREGNRLTSDSRHRFSKLSSRARLWRPCTRNGWRTAFCGSYSLAFDTKKLTVAIAPQAVHGNCHLRFWKSWIKQIDLKAVAKKAHGRRCHVLL